MLPSAKKVQALLGHSSITQTMDTYSHLLEDIGGDAVDAVDDAFEDPGLPDWCQKPRLTSRGPLRLLSVS